MKWIIEVAFLVILAISTTAYRHVNKDAVIEEKEEMAELMKELEDETAVMQTGYAKHHVIHVFSCTIIIVCL